jgi:hypothetical protein
MPSGHPSVRSNSMVSATDESWTRWVRYVLLRLCHGLNVGAQMEIDTTEWFPLDQYAPARDGWYEVKLTSGDTAFSRFVDAHWTEQPVLVFTHWRGLSADPGVSPDTEQMDAQAAAAQGVRAVWNAFFPGTEETHSSEE